MLKILGEVGMRVHLEIVNEVWEEEKCRKVWEIGHDCSNIKKRDQRFVVTLGEQYY